MADMSGLLDSGEQDRISGLPWLILNIILSKLTIGDTMRTSVLSRNWRYKWLSLTDFHLDANKFAEILNHRCRNENVGEDSDEVDIVAKKIEWDVVTSVINTYIHHHTNSIRSFSLKATCGKKYREMGQWMHHLSKQAIEALSIEDTTWSHSKMPSHIFSFEKLKSLRLISAALKIPSSFGSIKWLNELYLERVYIREADLLHLILSCPLLEYLTLLYISKLRHLRIHAPKLIELSVTAGFEDIVIEAASNLSKVRISGFIGESFNVWSVIRCLSGIGSLRVLDLTDGFMRALGTTDGLLLRNDTVTSLILDNMEYYRFKIDSVKGCLSVLSSCRNIKHFTLFVSFGSYPRPANEFFPENQGQHSFTKLESITLVCRCYSQMGAAVDFIKFIAFHSPNLKFITIQTEGTSYPLGDYRIITRFKMVLKLRQRFPHVLVTYEHFEQPNRAERGRVRK